MKTTTKFNTFILISIIVFILTEGFIYVILAYLTLESNPLAWDIEQRSNFVAGFILVLVINFLINFVIYQEKFNSSN